MYAYYYYKKTCPYCSDIIDVFYEKAGVTASIVLYSCRNCFHVFDEEDLEKAIHEMKHDAVKNRIRKYFNDEDIDSWLQ